VVSYYRAFAPKSEAVKYMDYRATLIFLTAICHCLIPMQALRFWVCVHVHGSCGRPVNMGTSTSGARGLLDDTMIDNALMTPGEIQFLAQGGQTRAPTHSCKLSR